MSKENDLILTLLANPQFTTEDFLKVGLSANNTSLEDELRYLDSETIQSNPLFLNDSGEFDKNKFHSVYLGASKIMLDLSTENPQTVYSKYNIFAPPSLRDMSPSFELIQSPNPDRITKSMITIGLSGPREKTPSEIAQSLQVYDSETGKWLDTPENLFSFKKLFGDFGGFLSDNFGKTKVLAQYDSDVDINGKRRGEAGFDENMIEHVKGEYMLNDNGTYYYRTLKDGENIYGKLVLHYSDILTREGSALNSIDFLDSDDIQKTPFGSFMKNASLIGAMFLPYVGPYITGFTIFQQAAGLGATLGKIALQDSDNPTLNWIEGLSETTNPINTRSEYSQNKMWTTENLLGMAGDVIGLLWQQRMIFKWAPVITQGKWGLSKESLNALKAKYISEIEAKNINSLEKIVAKYGKGSILALKGSAELLANAEMEAANLVENYMKKYYKSGEQLSKAYMTILTVNDIYGEAKEAGASDFDASVITLGYAAMEYALLSTDIGKWVLPELRANRLENKAMVKALTKDTLEKFKQLAKEAQTSETAKRTYLQRLLDFGKKLAKAVMKGEFNVGLGSRAAFESEEGLLKAGFGSLFAGASAEAIEETSEEVLADFSRVLFNGLLNLKGNKDIKLKTPWEDEHFFDRYAMSFLGGFLGGGVSSAVFDFSLTRKILNMDYNTAVQQFIYKARNNDLDGIYKILNSSEAIGNKNLSATKFVEDENGERVWKQGDENDNQDLAIKNLAKRQIKLWLDTLNAHGGNMSDENLIEALTLKDIRFRVLQQSTTAGNYIQKYNQLLEKLYEKTSELRGLSSVLEKAENGETDEKLRLGKSESDERHKKLEEEIKQIDEQIDNFNSGKLAPLFMTSALLETTPFISEVFLRSSFKTFAENKANTKFNEIPEAELKTYLNEYLNYLRTSKKDDLDFATEGYLALQRMIKENFEEAVEVSLNIFNDEELKQLLGETNINTTVLSASNTDDDSWLEAFLNYIQENPLIEKFTTSILLLRNTSLEELKNLKEKYDSDLQAYKEKLDSNEWDEELYNNSVQELQNEYQRNVTRANDNLQDSLAKLNSEIFLQLGIQLADKFINLGYINGAIKDLVISKLNELSKTIKNHINDLATSYDDETLNLIEKLDTGISELNSKIEQVQNLKYTPILQNLDKFALNLNGLTVSKVLEELGRAIQTNKTNISAFTFGKEVHHAINEADRVLDLYIAALEGARVDSVDPFNTNKANLWGINKTLNEIHSKAPKIENDTWEDLPEIEGGIADMLLMDAYSIKNLLLSYKKLFYINKGKKLEMQSRVGIKTSFLLYDRIRRLLVNSDLPDILKGTDTLQSVFDSLKLFEERINNKDVKDWDINLSLEELIELERERISLENAIFDLFNTEDNLNKLELFFSLMFFNLGDKSTTLLNEDSQNIDDTSVIGYLASKMAIKSSDFYSRYKEILKKLNPEHPIAPILGQEIGVLLSLANILNGPVITKIIEAYRNSVIKYLEPLSFEERKKFFIEKCGESVEAASIFATDSGFNNFIKAYDIIPLYDNITFIDGIAGSGKTSAIGALTIKYLQEYNKEILGNVLTIHAGDNTGDFAKGLRTALGLAEDSEKSLGKDLFMDKLVSDRKVQLEEDGKSYKFKENSDYKVLNGKIIPIWKPNNLNELPTLIVIDEAQLYTQLDLLTIDKFAKEYGIPVIMFGDLQQSQTNGIIDISSEIKSQISKEFKKNNIVDEKGLTLKVPSLLTLKLNRNQVLHGPKIGTSMRTENNLKNVNMSMLLTLIELGGGNAVFHYYEDDKSLAGDKWLTPNLVEEVKKTLDKIIPQLKEGEKINFAYSSEDSEIYKALKADNKYWDKINPIKGVALGQEGNYWILDINAKQPIDSYLLDLYTGITRARKASILISDKTPNLPEGRIEISSIQDQETHPEIYSKKDIQKSIDKRILILEKALPEESQDIPYSPRSKVETPSRIEATPETKVITEGIKAVGEALQEQSSAFTETTVLDFLKKPNVEQIFKENYCINASNVLEVVLRAIDDSENEDVKRILSKILDFDSAKTIIEEWINSVLKVEPSSEVIEEPLIEEIEEESISKEEETQKTLSEANIENNSPSVERSEISELSIEGFNFFLFSNATFELGTTQINNDGTFSVSPIKGRIDSLNGIAKLTGNYNYQDAVNKLAKIRELLKSMEEKSELESLIAEELGINETYIRFALKTSEFSDGGHGNFDKLDKLENESLPYARALVDPNSESNYANNRNLVAIIGSESLGDVLELPLLTLNNPLTIINQKTENNPKFPEIYYAYWDSYNKWESYAFSLSQIQDPEGFAQVHALDDLISSFDGNPNYQGLINLIKEYRALNRHITFIDDENWTIAKNLHSFGPQLNISRGFGLQYLNLDYVQDEIWIPLEQLLQDPQLHFSNIMHDTDKSGKIEDETTGELITLVTKPKHPFVLYTDETVDHNGNDMFSDEGLMKEYIYLKMHPEVRQSIKLVYVLPPKFTLKEYLLSLIDFSVNKGNFILGNQRTPYKILEALIENELNNEILNAFLAALGEQTGLLAYDKIVEVVNQLKNLSVEELIQALVKDAPQAWNINGIFGILKEVKLYQQLQNTLKQLVYPTSISELGNIIHKGSNRFDELFPTIEKVFNRSGLDMFFQTRGSKELSKLIFNRFSPIQNVSNGRLQNDYIEDKQFRVNGNITTSTYLANSEFNGIIAKSVAKLKTNLSGQVITPDNVAYTNGYSGFNRSKTLQLPSISQGILLKLNSFGIKTSVTPNTSNDDSLELKLKIAEEINSNLESSIRALVLPNGELILGENNLFKGKLVVFNLNANPFKSLLSYMFEVSIDGIVYDVNYSDTNYGKNMELTQRGLSEVVYNFGEYSPVNSETLKLNIDKLESLLNVLSLSSKMVERKILSIRDNSSNEEEYLNNIANFLNNPITKAIFKKMLNFDFSIFSDMLEFEQQQDSCATSINIKFI